MFIIYHLTHKNNIDNILENSLSVLEAKIAPIVNKILTNIVIKDDRILLPAAGMNSTEADVKVNNKVKVTLGSKEVEGFNNYQGTGFLIKGTANFIESGKDFDMMKEKYPFLRKVLEIKVESEKQLL